MSTIFSIPGKPDDESFGSFYRLLWNCVKAQPESGVLRAAFATVTQYMNGQSIEAQDVRVALKQSSGMAGDLLLLRDETAKRQQTLSPEHAGLLKGAQAIYELFREIDMREKEGEPFPAVLCRKIMTRNGVPAPADFVAGPLRAVDVVVAMRDRPAGLSETADESFYLSYMQLRAAVRLGPPSGPRSLQLKDFLASAAEFASSGHIDEERLACGIEIARDMSLKLQLQENKNATDGKELSADRQNKLAGALAACALFNEIKRRQEAAEALSPAVRKDILAAVKVAHLRLVP